MRSRVIYFRILTVLLALTPFVVIELLLTVLGLPTRKHSLDPYVDLQHLQPLFQLTSDGSSYEIPAERLNLFRPARFSAAKGNRTFRIFALGGSTTQGEPYSTETAFPEWMRLNLQLQCAEKDFEVINCGGLSYASYRVRAILQEVLQYQPDLIVIYTGHNEFLERRTYAAWQNSQQFRLRELASRCRTVQFLSNTFTSPNDRDNAKDKTVMAQEVEALLDYQHGLQEYRRGDAWYAGVAEQFGWNIEAMIEDCRSAKVPLLFVRPTSNLLDCPPFKSDFDPALTDSQLLEAQRLSTLAREPNQPIEPRVAALKLLLDIDPGHADSLYLMGLFLYEQEEWLEAHKYFKAARDADVCPLRATSQIVNVLTEVTAKHDVPLVDAEQILTDPLEHGIAGNRWLIDHVHPKIEGHQKLAESLAETIARLKLFSITYTNWQADRKTVYDKHLQNLGEEYYQRGQQRLHGLQLWTQGRAKKIRS